MSITPSPAPPQGGGRSQRARQVEAFDGACTQLFLIPIASVFHAGAGLEADLGALMPHGKRKLCETFYAKHPEYKYPSSSATPLKQNDGTLYEDEASTLLTTNNNADSDNNLVVIPNTPVTAKGVPVTASTTTTIPGCPNGAECPFIHADLREVTPMIVHRNLMYSGVHMCKYRQLVNTAGEAILAEKEPGLGLLDVEGSNESLRAKAVHDVLNAARIDVLAPNGRPPYQSYNLNVLLHTDGAKILFNYLVDPQFEALRLAIRTRHTQLLASTNADEGQEPVPPPPTDVLQIRLEERVTPAGEDPVPPPPVDIAERGDPAAPYSHCAHFYFNRLCYRGEMCHFVHCVHVDNLLAIEDDGIAVSPAPPSVNSFPSIRRSGGAGTEAQGGGHRAMPNESRRGGGAAHHHNSAPTSSAHQYPSHHYVPAGYAVGMYPIHSAPAGFVPYQSFSPDPMAIPQYPLQQQLNLSQYQPQQMMYQPMMVPSMMPMYNTGITDPSLQGGGAGGTWQFVPQQQPFYTSSMMGGSVSSAAISNYSPTPQMQFSMPIHQQPQQFVVPQQYGFLSQPTTTTGAASVNSTPPASASSWMGSTGGVGGTRSARSSSQQVNVLGSGSWAGSGADFQGGPITGTKANSQSTFGGMSSYNAPAAPSQSRLSSPQVQGSSHISTASLPNRTLSNQGKDQPITVQGQLVSTPTLGSNSQRNSSTSSIVGQSPQRVTSSSQGSVTVGTRNNSDLPHIWAISQQQQGGVQGGFYPSAFQPQQGQPSSAHPHQSLRQ